ncbi:MAG: hypothetical protein HYW45_04025 [Candidatus Daviesbacteria bacterium]|nr:MAG: hypothetical protein HYW45_04025 [Candidatus Daviesbacteria bacterium]
MGFGKRLKEDKIKVNNQMNYFDPIIFLELDNLPSEEMDKIRPILMERITEFIVLRFSQDNPEIVLSADKFEYIFPQIDRVVLKSYLEEFKNKMKS